MYEALRAYFLEESSSREVARRFGYSPGYFRILCHQFRRDPNPVFFSSPPKGPRTQPKKSVAREVAVSLRKQNYSVYEISDALKEKKIPLSPTAVMEVLKQEGFAALPRRLDVERPNRVRPTIEPVANVHEFQLSPGKFTTRCGGLFLFIPDLVRLQVDKLSAHFPGSKMIPAAHALRAALSLKLWSIERKSHVMALVADEGLALFCGLNAVPKKSYFSEYSSRTDHKMITKLLGIWHAQSGKDNLFSENSFNLDFHSVPYYGDDPTVEKHYVSMRSRSQPSILAFVAQDSEGRAFCYSNADIRKGEEADEVLNFISFWKKTHGKLPAHLVFDSKLTTYEKLLKIDDMNITFITLRRRSPKLLEEIALLPKSAWRQVELDVPSRKFKTPRVYEQTVNILGRDFRQLFIQDLGHDEPTILLTNDRKTPGARTSPAKLITRYAQRMLIENALSDAVRFFHVDALSSAVGMKVDFDMALMVVASGLYRLLARKMRGYSDAQARNIFRDLLDMPADVTISESEVLVRFHRRAHLPIIRATGLLDKSVTVPWWNNYKLRLSAD